MTLQVLELFSGTGSVGKVCDQLGWDVVSVDMMLPATHRVDIMLFDYKQYPKDSFDIVWASPPCTAYSRLQQSWLGRKKKDGIIFTQETLDALINEADCIVKKAQEIIEYFNPELWFLENPATGKLKERDFMSDIPFYDVSYCMYSDWGYEKKTRIWTNKKEWNHLQCDKSGRCGNMIGKKHRVNVSKVGCGQQHNTEKDLKFLGRGTNRIDRYRIPEDLIFSLFMD